MADIIRITKEEIEELSSHFADAGEELDERIRTLQTLVDDTSSGWEGAAYTAFQEKYEEIRAQLEQVVEMYHSIDEMLDQVVSTMQETDSSIASAISGN